MDPAPQEAHLTLEDVLEEYDLSERGETEDYVAGVFGACDTTMDGEQQQDMEFEPSQQEDMESAPSAEDDPSRLGRQPVMLFGGMQAEAYCADLRGNLLLAGGGDDAAYLFDTDRLELLKKFEGFGDSVIECRFLGPDVVLVVAMNGKMQICRIQADDPSLPPHAVCEFDGPEEVVWMHVCRDCTRAMVLGSDGSLWLLSLAPAENDDLSIGCLAVGTSSHVHAVTSGAVSADEKFVLSGDQSGLITLWAVGDADVRSRLKANAPRPHREEKAEGGREVTCLCFHATSPHVFAAATISGDFAVFVASAASSCSTCHQGRLQSSIECMLFAPLFPALVVSDMAGSMVSLDSNSFHERWRLQLDDGITQISSTSGSRDSPSVVASLANGAILKVDCRTGDIVGRWMGSIDSACPVHMLRVHDREQQRMVAAFEDGNVQVYEL